MKVLKSVRHGFSLIELLTVIAIMAILAAVLFPVFARVREKARQTSCISNMHQLYVGMRLYREDNGKYPAALLGFAQTSGFISSTGTCSTTGQPGDTTEHCFYPDAGTIAPIANLTYKPLSNSQKYLQDKEPFICPDASQFNRTQNLGPNDVTTAVYPPTVPLAGATAEYTKLMKDNCCRAIPIGNDIYFYKYDSYDVGPLIDDNGKLVPNAWEVHYALDWTGVTNANDPQNQLKYANAPEDKTVVTWCTYHAGYGGSDMALVMMLDGKARTIPMKEFVQKGPLGIAP